MNNAETIEHDKKLLLQVFHYLQALDQLKNPVPMEINSQPWLLWFRDMPEHPTIRRGNVADITDDVSSADDYILKVARPELSDPPTPPAQLLSWVEKGWQEVNGSIKVISQKEEKIAPNAIRFDDDSDKSLLKPAETIIIRFEDDPERPRLLTEWAPKREAWASKERPARQAMTIFTKLSTFMPA